MQKRQFAHFEELSGRGRPRVSPRTIAYSGDPRLRWTDRHSELLNSLPARPLAFYFQLEVRVWWVYQWERYIDVLKERRKRPISFYDLHDPIEMLHQSSRMIRWNPIVTLRSLQEFGFIVPMLSELAVFYWAAKEERMGRRPTLVTGECIAGTASFKPNDFDSDDYDAFLIRNDISRKEKRAAFNRMLETTMGRGWGFNVKSMRPHDALHYMDLRIFELIDNEYIKPSIKAEIIDKRHKIASSSLHAPSWKTSSPNYLKYKIPDTRLDSYQLLARDSTSSVELRAAANAELLEMWKDTSGKGDGKFALPESEADYWPY
jgi:hypothetical protein